MGAQNCYFVPKFSQNGGLSAPDVVFLRKSSNKKKILLRHWLQRRCCVAWRDDMAVRSGAAGLIVSVNRIITKALMSDVRASTMLFFGVSIAFVVVCCLAFHATRCTDFIRFYVSMCRSSAVSDDQLAIMRPSVTESAAIGEEVSLVSFYGQCLQCRNRDNLT